MAPQNRLENRARDALAKALKNDPGVATAFRDVVYRHAGRSAPAKSEVWEVDREYRVRSDGRLDLLVRFGRDALIVETKIWDKEKLHQYLTYPRFLKEQGFTVCCVGLLAKKGARNGRQLLLEEFFDQAADARIIWGDLISELRSRVGNNATFEELARELRSIEPALLAHVQNSGTSAASLTPSDFVNFAREPKKFVKFCLEFIKSLGAGIFSEPSQGGNSPVGIAFGKEEWGGWFGDGFTNRIKLVFESPRPSKPAIRAHFRFTVILWNKTSSGNTLKRERVEQAARSFSALGCDIFRNVPFDHHHGERWQASTELDSRGLLYLNAFDDNNFLLPLAEASSIGWRETLSRLNREATRLMSAMDKMTAN
jgi:hypothetical protein